MYLFCPIVTPLYRGKDILDIYMGAQVKFQEGWPNTYDQTKKKLRSFDIKFVDTFFINYKILL